MSRFGLPVAVSHALGTAGAVIAFVAAASPIAAATNDAPKAYIGLFGDNAIAVLDTATNHVTKTIAVPARSSRAGDHP